MAAAGVVVGDSSCTVAGWQAMSNAMTDKMVQWELCLFFKARLPGSIARTAAVSMHTKYATLTMFHYTLKLCSVHPYL